MHLSRADLRRHHLIAVEHARGITAEAHEHDADHSSSRRVLDENRDRPLTRPPLRKRRERSDEIGGSAVGGCDVQRITGRRPLDVPVPFCKPAQPTLQPPRADVEGARGRQKVTAFQVAPPSCVISNDEFPWAGFPYTATPCVAVVNPTSKYPTPPSP